MRVTRFHNIGDVTKYEGGNLHNANVMIFVYLESCPFCLEMLPEWNRFKNKMNRKQNLQILEVNKEILQTVIRSDREYFSSKLKNIPFVPTVSLYIPTKKSYSYLGDRSCDDLTKFTNSLLYSGEKLAKPSDATSKQPKKSKKLSEKDRVRRIL
tara:strand:- start:264 stop:725 length:462 start_codon:yes stop_codon:yes gene_type:complete